MSSRVDKSLIEFQCVGKVVFVSGEEFQATFSVRQLAEGSIVGVVDFVKPDEDMLMKLSLGHFGEFNAEGVESKDRSTVRVERCFFTRGWEFMAFLVTVNPEALDRRIEREVHALLDVTNVRRTFRVILETPLGTLQLAHDPEIGELEWVMDSMGISLVTSQVQIFAESAAGMSVRQLIERVEETVNGFLQIARLGYTCWYDWCNLRVYEKEDSGETMKPLAIKMRVPRRTLPISRGITTVAHSDFFMREAYKGYNKGLEKKFGFDTALYWYIESNLTEVAQSRYLLACTCLELLTDRFVKDKGMEFIISKDFNSVYEALKEAARTWLHEKGIEKPQRMLMYDALRGANRPSFKSKIEGLLQELRVRYDDIDLDIEKIVTLRNEITHTGTTTSRNLLDDYDKLFVVLTRIFLVLLGYDKDYYDFVKEDWVQMKDVLTA
jgi:hypothetical protein